MKRNFKFYIAFWLLLVAVFNVIAFVSVGWAGQEKYTSAYWCGYIFITLTFLLNLAYAAVALCSDNLKKVFYNLAFFRKSYAGLILAFVVGGLFMLTSVIPGWVCIFVAVILMGMNTISLLKAKAAASIVEDTDEKISQSTRFVKLLIADAQALIAVAENDEARKLAQKVYEAVRYSDPVSNGLLAEIEQKIKEALDVFETAIRTNGDNMTAAADNLLYLIKSRNEKCKALK